MNKFTKFLSAALILGLGFTSCNKTEDPNDNNSGKSSYAIWTQVGSWPNTNYYILSADDLTQGSAKLEGSGIDVTTTLNNSVIAKDGYYYFYNSAEGKFGKYQLENGAVNTIKQIPMTNLKSLAGHVWIDDHTLVMIGLNATSTGVNYSVVNTNAMSFTNGSVTGLPAFIGDFKAYQVGGDIQYRDGKLYFPVCLHNTTAFTVYPRLYTMAVSYPGFSVTTTSTDDRVAGVGNTSGYFATSFVDKNGDMYFLTSWNLNWNDSGERGPKSIFRIKQGQDVLDPEYYINVLAETGHEASAGVFMDLGNGRAILKYQEIEGYDNTKDGYTIIELATGKEYRKLTEIPVIYGGERNVLIENGKAYIAVKTAGDKDYIYIYDSATDKVTRGLEIAGGYVSFSRIDKLN